MNDQIRDYLLLQKDKLIHETNTLQLRIKVIQDMIDDLPKVTPVLTPTAAPVVVEAPRKQRKDTGRKRGTYKPRTYDAPTADMVRTALEAAGEHGLTARELAELADMPNGTASGRLSNMKKQGLVMHIAPKYFAIHSEPQDNNQ